MYRVEDEDGNVEFCLSERLARNIATSTFKSEYNLRATVSNNHNGNTDYYRGGDYITTKHRLDP